MRMTSSRTLSLLLVAVSVAACNSRSQPAEAEAPGAAATAASAASAPATASAVPPEAVPPQAAALPGFTALVEQVGPAVVNVTTVKSVGTRGAMATPLPDDPFFEYFRRFLPTPGQGGGREFRARGIGSGFIIDAQGLILTNAHVVAEADEVTVRLASGNREFKAKVLGTDPQTDVALLKVEASNLPVVRFGDSSALKAGEWVAAIGSPFGLANTITAGIVSATERDVPDESFVPFIQTDVAINPGNSGGPLINTRGEVVGINSQIYSRTGGYMGVSFAIPIQVAKEVAEQLRTQGKVTRGRLGVGIQEVTEPLAQSFRLQEPKGALVSNVEPGSPAGKAGLQAGDVILRFGDEPVADAGDLPRLVANTAPGKQVQIEVWRDGARKTLNATVGEMPAPQQQAAASPAGGRDDGSGARLGVTVAELPPQMRRQMGVDYGLVVQGVQDPASPLRPGDVIVAIDNERFNSLEQFKNTLSKADPQSPVPLLVRRGEASLYVAVPLAKGAG